ncbi:MAG: ABC transporter permease [Armatimonadetes bacterium]|nr:ABC transporter permease [Armatimonadota bacterium]
MVAAQHNSESTDGWTAIIKPKRRWFDVRLRELWDARELVALFVWRDFVSLYKQTILGPLWYVIQPLATTVVFTVVFGRIAGMPTDKIPQSLFYLSGIVIWNYFAACLTKTSQTFVANVNLFGKVYFPRLTVPISVVLSNLTSFAIQFVMFIGLFVYFVIVSDAVQPGAWIAMFPVIVVMVGCLGFGLGIIVSSLTTKYRDLQYLVVFGTQLAMYASPVVYPLSSVHGGLRWVILANPVTGPVEFLRRGFLGAGDISTGLLLYSLGFTFFVVVVGLLLFNRIEQTFMDTI